MSTRKTLDVATDAPFEAYLEGSGEDVILSVRGEIADASAGRLDEAIEEARQIGRHLTLDLTGASIRGPKAVETLQRHGAQVAAQGHHFTLRAITPMIDHLLRLGFGDLLGVRRRSMGMRPVVLPRRR